MSGHTSGPWEVGGEIESMGDLVYIPIRRGKLKISTTGVFGKKPDGSTAGRPYKDRAGIERHTPVISADECRANAHLIAAAPELYEALENMAAAFETMLSHYKRTMPPGDAYQRERLLQKACEAIAKSRGEVPATV